MGRIARVAVPGLPCHVTQRGNGRRVIFDTDGDRLLYLSLLREYARQYSLSLWAWRLMGNHLHLVAVPRRPDSLAKTLGRTHADYARYLNIRRRSCGHLFQARFYSCVIGPQHLWMTVAYVERNPQRAGIVVPPWDYRWSSAKTHVAGLDSDGLLDLTRWRLEYTPERWQSVLMSTADDEADLGRLRLATLSGRPFCEAELLAELESILDRPLAPKCGGRPKAETPHTASASPS